MKVTIEDIAKVASVSVSTVSRVLNNKKYVSEDTRKKVLEVVKELDYRPDNIARSMITKRTNTIGLVIPDLTNPFYAETSKVIVDVAREYGFSTIICNTDNQSGLRQEEYIDTLQQKRVDGIIFGSVRTKEQSLNKLNAADIPYITYHRRLEEDDSNFVVSDDINGIYNAVEYLASLGHQHIGYISGPRCFSTSTERLRGFLKARKDFSIKSDPQLIKDGGYSEEQAWEATQELLELKIRPTAILAANDLMALSALDCCLSFDLSVPDDISIMGYDDITLSSHARINLTTVSVKPKIMAKKATKLFIEKKLKKSEEKAIQVTLEPKLTIRKTTASKSN
ncbi:LacI family transcriptional regulator [Natroniella acetigena]|uniref:LacI family DNA-binding transcriptional regulator n=1 Tax=Natroniella acetigena TaxID=52004 RepID=UPI00200B2D98|nr:LacI family DNA-binding transcriptional regulator [Natroniella acetigena]MCK8827411.1 LacI family transcriptional regulator [Natroniella acetigena]